MTHIHALLEAQLAGYFKIEAFKQDAKGNEIPGTRRIAAGWFPNLITNAGLDYLGANGSYVGDFYACGVGSGSTTPAFTNTALDAQVARTSNYIGAQGGTAPSAPYYGWRRIKWRFATGTAAGNLSEVGVFSATTGGTMWSRALIVDGSGNPTTITVLSDETLDVTYELRLYPPTSDAAWGPLNFTIDGVATAESGVIRASGVTSSSYMDTWVPGEWTATAAAGLIHNSSAGNVRCLAYETQTLGAITSSPTGTGYNATSVTPAAYTNGNYYRDHTVLWDLNAGNTGTIIGSFKIPTIVGSFQASINPGIPKNSSKRFILNVRVSYARYTP